MINPFVVAAVVASVAALGLLIRWVIATTSLRQEARQEYASRRADRAHTIEGVSEADFIRIYMGGYAPRWTVYAALALFGAIAITPPAVMGLVGFWNWIIEVVAAGDVFAPG